jgi:hypothetical protein
MKVKNLKDLYMLQAIVTIFDVFWLFSSVFMLKVEFLIEHSFSKYFSQNGEIFHPKNQNLGFAFIHALVMCNPHRKPSVHTCKKITNNNFIYIYIFGSI